MLRMVCTLCRKRIVGRTRRWSTEGLVMVDFWAASQ
jgi:hypothetical protein